jgi:glyoxylase-like metal-dependent hydrolase (beta-lactamase superfamily II)
LDNLRAARYRPDQVDEIYLTHLHRDHVGGLSRSGALEFPNSVIHINRVDFEYRLDPANKDKEPTYLATMFPPCSMARTLHLHPTLRRTSSRLFDGTI